VIKIFIVDDHALVRTGMRHILATRADFQVVGEADCGERALEQLVRLEVDLVLMDLNMPGMGGIEATRRVILAHPGIKVIALSALTESNFPRSLYAAGALGYISKGCASEELFRGIEAVMQGRPFISAEVAFTLSQDAMQGSGSPFARLSGRELDILMCILAGNRTQQIAELTDLNPKTVGTYRYRILSKLGVRSDVELTLLCLRHGLLPEETFDSHG
jgi:two-component system invasion response regulator UvrY